MSRQFTMEVGNYKVVNKRHFTRKKKTMKPTVLSSLFLRLAFSFPAKGKESYFTINTESISFYFFLFAPAWVTKPIAFPGIPFRTRAEKQRLKKGARTELPWWQTRYHGYQKFNWSVSLASWMAFSLSLSTPQHNFLRSYRVIIPM